MFTYNIYSRSIHSKSACKNKPQYIASENYRSQYHYSHLEIKYVFFLRENPKYFGLYLKGSDTRIDLKLCFFIFGIILLRKKVFLHL